MRILHLVQRYWPAHGGAEIHLHELSTRFAAAGHHVTVATTDTLDFELFWDPRARRVPKREETRDGVLIRRFPVRHLPGAPLSYPALRRLIWLFSRSHIVPTPILHRLARFTPWLPDLWNWIDCTDEHFDLIAGMTICFEPLLEAGLRFAEQRNVPFVAYPTTHLGAGVSPGADTLSRFYTMRHQMDLVRSSDAVAAQTAAERDFYVQHGVPADRIVVAGPGVNPDDLLGGDGDMFRQKHNISSPLVVSISAMAYDKGTIPLVDAVRTLWAEGYDVELALAGAILTPFRQYLENLPAEDRERVRVFGPISEDEKRNMLAAADLFAMPSRTDSFGIVYLEAWLYRTPVIGATTWGVKDVITDGEDGLLIPFGDVPALANAIRTLLDTPERRHAMGIRGEQKVYNGHTWDHKYQIIQDLYTCLTGRS